jgi:hypothetical protein
MGAAGLAVVATEPLVKSEMMKRTFYYLGGREGKSRKAACR